MQWFQLRPTFVIQLDESCGNAIEKLRVQRDQVRSDPTFLMFGEYGEFHLPPREHRLWSPHLSFYITEGPSEDGSSGCIIRGLFAPRVEVWTVLWIVYLAMSFTVFFGLILGYSQWMLGQMVWGFAIGLIALFIIAAIYVIANIGQQWSIDQMHELRERLDQTLDLAGVRRGAAVTTAPAPVLSPT